MSTTARKARKRAGIPFAKPAKTPTPVEERSFLATPARRQGDATPAGFPAAALNAPRSPKRAERFIENGGRP